MFRSAVRVVSQGMVDLAAVFEAILSNANDNILTAITSHQFGTRHWEPRVISRCDARLHRAGLVQVRLQEVLGCPDSEIGVVGYLKCTAPRPF